MLDKEKDGIYTTRINGITIGALTRQQTIDAVECYECSAPRGTACYGCSNGKSHYTRHTEAMKLYGIRPPQSMLSGRHIDKWYRSFQAHIRQTEPKRRPRRRASSRARKQAVTVRYECPLCGGDHPRSEHQDRAA